MAATTSNSACSVLHYICSITHLRMKMHYERRLCDEQYCIHMFNCFLLYIWIIIMYDKLIFYEFIVLQMFLHPVYYSNEVNHFNLICVSCLLELINLTVISWYFLFTLKFIIFKYFVKGHGEAAVRTFVFVLIVLQHTHTHDVILYYFFPQTYYYAKRHLIWCSNHKQISVQCAFGDYNLFVGFATHFWK